MTELPASVNPILKKRIQNTNKTSAIKNTLQKTIKKPTETVKELSTNVRDMNSVLKQKVPTKVIQNKGIIKKSKTQTGGTTSYNVPNSSVVKKPQQHKAPVAKDPIVNNNNYNKDDAKKIKPKRTLKSNADKLTAVKNLKPQSTIVTNLTNNDEPQLVQI